MARMDSQAELICKASAQILRANRMLAKQQVYLALSPSAGVVKIGVSIDPLGRTKDMRTARPDIQLLITLPGGRELEKRLHQRFRGFISQVNGFTMGLRYMIL
jgi:hypothetical protein